MDKAGKVAQTLEILAAVGIPIDSLTKRCKESMALAVLAVANVRTETPWSEAACWEGDDSWALRSRDLIRFMNEHYGERIADSSYDDIRRQDLKLPVLAELVTPSAREPDASTNSPTRRYAISPAAVHVFRTYGTPDWPAAVEKFLQQTGSLEERMARRRLQEKVAVVLPDGANIDVGRDVHSQLQLAVLEEFLPRFAPGAEIVYFGGTAKKSLHVCPERLEELGFPQLVHETLPDIVAFDAARGWIFLVEAVHTSNPVNMTRHLDLERMTKGCSNPVVFVTVFKDRDTFRKFAADISWETEVWMADSPSHMIHYNGEKFLGPHSRPDT